MHRSLTSRIGGGRCGSGARCRCARSLTSLLAAGALFALLFAATAATSESAATPAHASGTLNQTADKGMPQVNGPVKALAAGPDGTTYVGGTFTYIGARTGGAVVLDPVTARRYTRFARVTVDDGDGVRSVISDGQGGFYVGGNFWIDEHYRVYRGLAHLRSDGSWDPRFRDPGYDARCLALSGKTLFVGGASTSVDGRRRYHVAAFDAVTGESKKWNAHLTGGSVTCLAVSGRTLFVGGAYSASIGGHLRRALAAFDAQTGRLLPWDAAFAKGTGVRTLAVSGSRLYVGGFTADPAHPLLQAMDVQSGARLAWDPFAEAGSTGVTVDAVAASGSTVYLAGVFESVGGQTRGGLAAVDANTGLATPWDPAGPALSTGARVSSLVVLDGTVYVAGSFTSLGGQVRHNAAALDATTGLATAWDVGDAMSIWRGRPAYDARYAGDGYIYALGRSGSRIFVGGGFSYICGERRRNLAAIGPDGRVTDWDPEADWGVRTLVVSGQTVYAGGSFRQVAMQRRDRLAALDAISGQLLPWDPGADGAVNALAVSGSLVYAGGQFSTIGGSARESIAALDAGGAATPWNPGAARVASRQGPVVRTLAVSASRVYAGGDFTAMGGDARRNIAAIDVSSGLATPWNPSADKTVRALALSGSKLYVGGSFTSLGGKARSRLGAVDTETGATLAFAPRVGGLDADVGCLAILGHTLYLGGTFTSVGGEARMHAAAVSGAGRVTPWRPSWAIGPIGALAAADGRLWVGETERTPWWRSAKPYLARFSPVGP